MDAGQLRRLQLRQFAAVLHKNLLLQTRARKSILGIGGWGALLLQLLTPVAFFSLMCIPKYYIQPYVHPMYLETQEYQVDTKWWAGASPYEGAGPGAYPAHACRLHHDPATFSCRYCRQIWSWGCAQRMHRILAVSSTATSSPWGHALAAAGVAVHSLAALHHPLPPPHLPLSAPHPTACLPSQALPMPAMAAHWCFYHQTHLQSASWPTAWLRPWPAPTSPTSASVARPPSPPLLACGGCRARRLCAW